MILSPCLETESIERSVLKVCEHIDEKRNHPIDWYDYSEEQLWHELVSCILGSQVRYETAKACTKHLVENGHLNIQSILTKPISAERKITRELNKPIYPPFENGRGCRYRYPKIKSKYIIATCINLYRDGNSSLKYILKECKNAFDAREKFIEICKGIGPKQASLFLRNTSFCQNLAILDSHVMDYMKLMGLNEEINPKIVANKKQYFKNEQILTSYAANKKKTMASLDMAIWIVMRVVKREFIL